MEEIGVGVYGVGRMGLAHVQRIRERLRGARVVAVADPDPDFARAVAARPEVTGVLVEEDAAALCARPDVDGILVAAWDDAHEQAVLAGIRAGTRVFCEKPLTPTAAGCRRVIEAEVATGRRSVQVGFMRRFDRGYRDLRGLVSSGDLGSPLLAYCAHRNPSQPDGFEAHQIVSQVAVHEIDITRWLFGEEIVRVRVDESRRSSRSPEGLIDPLTIVLWTASGIRVNVEAVCFAGYGYDIRCEVLCEDGSAALAAPSFPAVRDRGGARTRIEDNWIHRFEDAYDTEIQSWIDSVGAGTSVGPNSWDGYAAQAVCDAAIASMDSHGDVVPVDLGPRPDLFS